MITMWMKKVGLFSSRNYKTQTIKYLIFNYKIIVKPELPSQHWTWSNSVRKRKLRLWEKYKRTFNNIETNLFYVYYPKYYTKYKEIIRRKYAFLFYIFDFRCHLTLNRINMYWKDFSWELIKYQWRQILFFLKIRKIIVDLKDAHTPTQQQHDIEPLKCFKQIWQRLRNQNSLVSLNNCLNIWLWWLISKGSGSNEICPILFKRDNKTLLNEKANNLYSMQRNEKNSKSTAQVTKSKNHSNILYKFINNELHLKEMYSSIWFLFSTPKKVISWINVIPNLYGNMWNVTRW